MMQRSTISTALPICSLSYMCVRCRSADSEAAAADLLQSPLPLPAGKQTVRTNCETEKSPIFKSDMLGLYVVHIQRRNSKPGEDCLSGGITLSKLLISIFTN